MNPRIVRLEVKFYAAAGPACTPQRSFQQLVVHHPVGLPAGAYTAIRKLLGTREGMHHLGRGIAAKEAGAECAMICRISEFPRADPSICSAVSPSKMPVLTAQAVERAALVEDRQVVHPAIVRSLADPVRDAICRQRIPVPSQQPSFRRPGTVNQAARLYRSKPTEAGSALRDRTGVPAEYTFPATFRTCRPSWQAERQPGLAVDLRDNRIRLIQILPNAIRAQPKGR